MKFWRRPPRPAGLTCIRHAIRNLASLQNMRIMTVRRQSRSRMATSVISTAIPTGWPPISPWIGYGSARIPGRSSSPTGFRHFSGTSRFPTIAATPLTGSRSMSQRCIRSAFWRPMQRLPWPPTARTRSILSACSGTRRFVPATAAIMTTACTSSACWR